MKTFRVLLGVAAVAGITGCGGGGGSSPTIPHTSPSAPITTSGSTRVKATVVIPRSNKHKATIGKRSPKYVSPSTLGLIVEVDQSVNGGTPAVYSQTGYDLTSNTSTTTCTAVSNGTQCTVYFNAPPTDATHSDSFSIYAYDTPQANPPSPTGDLLSEVVSSAVPSASGANASGIVVNQDNSLTFVLQPVVATFTAAIGSTYASSGTTLVLSAPGAGGSSNTMQVDGYDGGNNMIVAFLNGSGDDAYVNPIASGSTATQLTGSPASITSALSGSAGATYTPQTSDAPASSTSTPFSGTLALTDSFTGGYESDSTYPKYEIDATVAPLYAVSDNPTMVSSGFTTNVYAMQAALPTGVAGYTAYSLTLGAASATNDCSTYTVTGPSAGAANTDQQAVFAISASTPTSALTCALTVSDSISSYTITLSPTGSHANVTIPAKSTTPVQSAGGTIAPGGQAQFTVANDGDTILCAESFTDNAQLGSTSNGNYYIPFQDGTAYEYTGTDSNGYYAFSGLFGITQDVNSGDVITLQDGSGDGTTPAQTAYWCGEYANTSAQAIAQAYSFGSFGSLDAGSATPPYPNSGVVAFLAANDSSTPYKVAVGYNELSSTLQNPASLEVQGSASSLGSSLAPVDFTFAGGDGSQIVPAEFFVPVGTAAHSAYSDARHRSKAQARVRNAAASAEVTVTTARKAGPK